MTPIKGMRFHHKRVLDTVAFDGKTPQLYQVTQIASGWVFYKPVYNYGTREELGKSEKIQIANFTKIAGSL